MSGLRWCAVGAAVAVVCYALGRAACAQTMPQSVAPERPEPVVDFAFSGLPDPVTMHRSFLDGLRALEHDTVTFNDPLTARMRELIALDRRLEEIWDQGRRG